MNPPPVIWPLRVARLRRRLSSTTIGWHIAPPRLLPLQVGITTR